MREPSRFGERWARLHWRWRVCQDPHACSSPRPGSDAAFSRILLLCALILTLMSSAQAGAAVSSTLATPSIYLRGTSDH